MKWFLLALLVLVGSVAVALVALPDPGYVLIGYGKYSVESSLLVFLVLLVLVYFGVRALAGVWSTPGRLQRWESRRRERRLRRWFDAGTLELAEGRYERAERRLVRLLKSRQAPLQAYLSAAKAANRLQADERRNRYLALALQRQPDAEISILISQAELQLANLQSDQALTTLNRLKTLAPHSNQTLRLLMQLYLQLNDSRSLRELLPELRRAKVLNHEQWQALAVQVYREQVLDFASGSDVDTLHASWRALPPPVQQDSGMLAVYIETLIRLGAHQRAGQLLREQLSHQWNTHLAYLFGEVEEPDSVAQQAFAEHWLEAYPHNAILQITLAKISLRNKLWGKARSYLEASINGRPTQEAYRLLAALLEQLDEPDAAAACYREGLALSGNEVFQGLPAAADNRGLDTGRHISISHSV